MIELAVVVGLRGRPLYWHVPAGATAVSLPDSRGLWEVLWTHRDELLGVAHVHPAGVALPSATDVTTFAACEAGLGRRLTWWIVTDADVAGFVAADEPYQYRPVPCSDEDVAPWLHELRLRSNPKGGPR